jgi:hypothetical protein
LKVNLKGYQGNVKKSATVFSNDPQNPRFILTLQGTVKALIDVRPSTNVSFRGMAEQLGDQTIELVSVSTPFQIQKLGTDLEEKIAYQLETVEDGKHYRLKVSNRLKSGNYNGFIKLSTDMPKKPDIIVRVNGYIEGEIGVKPQTLLVGKLSPQQPVRTGKVLVVSNRNKPFQIKQLSFDEKLLQVSQQPLPNATGFTLEIIPNPQNVPVGGRQNTILTIETDAAPEEKQEVQIHVFNSAESPAATQAQSPAAQPKEESPEKAETAPAPKENP